MLRPSPAIYCNQRDGGKFFGNADFCGSLRLVAGVDLNHRPLGYECKEECHFNELRGQG